MLVLPVLIHENQVEHNHLLQYYSVMYIDYQHQMLLLFPNHLDLFNYNPIENMYYFFFLFKQTFFNNKCNIKSIF